MILPPPNQINTSLSTSNFASNTSRYKLTSSATNEINSTNKADLKSKPSVETIESQINQRLRDLSRLLGVLKIFENQDKTNQNIDTTKENLTHTKINTVDQKKSNPVIISSPPKDEPVKTPENLKTKDLVGSILGVSSNKMSKSQVNEARELFFQKLNNLEVKSGKYKGAYLSAPKGYISWYFANLALVHNIDNEPKKVKKYLNIYLENLEPNFSIMDIEADQKTKIFPDSDDSYAATYLQLASRYAQKTGDYAWFKANLNTLKQIADKNLIEQQKTNGLISTFQNGKPHNISYLMDNSEVYAGLVKFANVLRLIGDKDAEKYQIAANRVQSGINTLWDEKNNNWLVSDSSKASGKVFYPDLTAQIFPELYGLKVKNGAQRFDQAYNYFGTNDETWYKLQSDTYPWMILSYYNIETNRNTQKATEMIQNFTLSLKNSDTKYTINELGWAIGALNIL